MIPALNTIWCEKYRPQTIDEINIPQKTKDIINGYSDGIPHLLFVGSVGTGKTSLAQILVKNVLDCEYLYINASDENGIDTIRQKVTGFAQTKSFNGNLRVIILDEGDALTKNAQDCLRNLMESYAGYVRFIITGNYGHKLSNAIKSRCTKLDIRPSLRGMLERCVYILKEEGIDIPTDQKPALAKLVKTHFPDFRSCINQLQKSCSDGILSIVESSSTDELCEYIFDNIAKKKSLDTRKYLIERESLFNNDYEQLLRDFLNLIYAKNIDETVKKTYILTIAEYLYKSSLVTDKEINAFACILNLESI